MEGDGQGSVLFCLDAERKNLSRSKTLSGSVPLSRRETRWGKGKQRGTGRASPLCLAEEGARQGSLLVFRGQKGIGHSGRGKHRARLSSLALKEKGREQAASKALFLSVEEAGRAQALCFSPSKSESPGMRKAQRRAGRSTALSSRGRRTARFPPRLSGGEGPRALSKRKVQGEALVPSLSQRTAEGRQWARLSSSLWKRQAEGGLSPALSRRAALPGRGMHRGGQGASPPCLAEEGG